MGLSQYRPQPNIPSEQTMQGVDQGTIAPQNFSQQRQEMQQGAGQQNPWLQFIIQYLMNRAKENQPQGGGR